MPLRPHHNPFSLEPRIRSNLMKASLIAVLYLAAPSAHAQTVIFEDTFDTPDNVDINMGVEARQAGGATTSSYKTTGGRRNQSAIVSHRLERIGPGNLEANTDFADRIAGKSFALSTDIKFISTDIGWGSISLVSDTGPSRGTTPLSIRLNKDAVIVSSGRAGESPRPVETVFSVAQLSRILGVEFKIEDFHNYKYVVTENGSWDRAAFFIDGVEMPLKEATIDFGDETGRRINFVNASDLADIVFDNLKLTTISEP